MTAENTGCKCKARNCETCTPGPYKYGDSIGDPIYWHEGCPSHKCHHCGEPTNGKDEVNFSAYGVSFFPACKGCSAHLKLLKKFGITQEQYESRDW